MPWGMMGAQTAPLRCCSIIKHAVLSKENIKVGSECGTAGGKHGPVRDEPFWCRRLKQAENPDSVSASSVHSASWPGSLLSAVFVIPLHTSFTLFCCRLFFIFSPWRFFQLQILRFSSCTSPTSTPCFSRLLYLVGRVSHSLCCGEYYLHICDLCSFILIAAFAVWLIGFASGSISLSTG